MTTQAATATKTSLLRQPDFLKFWAGQTVSILGSSVSEVALPLVAVLTLNASPAQMGLLSTVSMLPTLLFTLFTGAWVDRLPRRPLMLWADVGRALVMGLIPLAMVLGRLSMGLVFCVLFISAALTDLFEIADMSFLPSLVGREHLTEGNSKMNASANAAWVVGPGLGGWLVQVISAPFAILFDALSFIVSVISLAAIRVPEAPPPVQAGVQPNIWREIRAGMDVILQNRILLAVTGCAVTYNIFYMLWVAQYDLYMVRSLHFSPAVIGLVLAAYAPGGLAGSLLADRAAGRFGVGRTLIASVLLAGLSLLLLLVSGGPFWLVLAAQLLAGFLLKFFLVIFNINLFSLRQAITPNHLLGRTQGTMRFLQRGAMPLAGLASGALGAWLGIWPTIAIGAVGTLLAFPWVLFSPMRSLKTLPEPAAEPPLPETVPGRPGPETPQNPA